MTVHMHVNLITKPCAASTTRGESTGNFSPLKLLQTGNDMRTIVSSEAFRFGLRRRMGAMVQTNRHWVIDKEQPGNDWRDERFETFFGENKHPYPDDLIFGFMSAISKSFRSWTSPLGVQQSISTVPYFNERLFSAASRNATPSTNKTGEKNDSGNLAPYSYGVHYTSYQTLLTYTPEIVPTASYTLLLLESLVDMGCISGNRSKFPNDFSPDSMVVVVTHKQSPLIGSCFRVHTDKLDETNCQWSYDITELKRLVDIGDINPKELFIAGRISSSPEAVALGEMGATVLGGISKAPTVVFLRYCKMAGITAEKLTKELSDSYLLPEGKKIIQSVIAEMKGGK